MAWLAHRLWRAVKWREDIYEHLTAATHSRDKQVRMELAARSDGTILGLRASMVVDVVYGFGHPPWSRLPVTAESVKRLSA